VKKGDLGSKRVRKTWVVQGAQYHPREPKAEKGNFKLLAQITRLEIRSKLCWVRLTH